MHDFRWAVVVREVELDDLDVGKCRSERIDSGGIRPVTAADEERVLVEPKQVSAFGGRRRRERRRDGNPQPSHVPSTRRGLRPAKLLAGPQDDRTPPRHDHRIERVDRVETACNRLAEDHLGAGRCEQLAQPLLLAQQLGEVRCRAPAVVAPESARRLVGVAQQHSAQLRRHALAAVGRLDTDCSGPVAWLRHVSRLYRRARVTVAPVAQAPRESSQGGSL